MKVKSTKLKLTFSKLVFEQARIYYNIYIACMYTVIKTLVSPQRIII